MWSFFKSEGAVTGAFVEAAAVLVLESTAGLPVVDFFFGATVSVLAVARGLTLVNFVILALEMSSCTGITPLGVVVTLTILVEVPPSSIALFMLLVEAA